METVDFFLRKTFQICQNVPKTAVSKLKYFLFIISILGILVQAHQKNLVQANIHPMLTLVEGLFFH